MRCFAAENARVFPTRTVRHRPDSTWWNLLGWTTIGRVSARAFGGRHTVTRYLSPPRVSPTPYSARARSGYTCPNRAGLTERHAPTAYTPSQRRCRYAIRGTRGRAGADPVVAEQRQRRT